MILAKSFAVPVELVQKTSSTVMTSEKPFFNPKKNAAGTPVLLTRDGFNSGHLYTKVIKT